MTFLWTMLSLEQLYTDDDTNDDDDDDDNTDNNDTNDDNNDKRWTNHDCIGSLACMTNEPTSSVGHKPGFLLISSYFSIILCRAAAKSNGLGFSGFSNLSISKISLSFSSCSCSCKWFVQNITFNPKNISSTTLYLPHIIVTSLKIGTIIFNAAVHSWRQWT